MLNMPNTIIVKHFYNNFFVSSPHPMRLTTRFASYIPNLDLETMTKFENTTNEFNVPCTFFLQAGSLFDFSLI